MPVNRSVKVAIAPVPAGAAGAAAAQSGTPAFGAQRGARVATVAVGGQGKPDAVPPILPPLRPSELAEMRRAEARQWQALSYQLPVGARYSNAEMDVFAAEGYVWS